MVCRTEDGFDVMDVGSGRVIWELEAGEEDVIYTAGVWDNGVLVLGRMDGVVEVWEEGKGKH